MVNSWTISPRTLRTMRKTVLFITFLMKAWQIIELSAAAQDLTIRNILRKIRKNDGKSSIQNPSSLFIGPKDSSCGLYNSSSINFGRHFSPEKNGACPFEDGDAQILLHDSPVFSSFRVDPLVRRQKIGHCSNLRRKTA